MTRKHFEAIARRIREIPALPARTVAAVAMADVCREFNPLFDRERFLRACGV